MALRKGAETIIISIINGNNKIVPKFEENRKVTLLTVITQVIYSTPKIIHKHHNHTLPLFGLAIVFAFVW
jgi:hypothetical protein